MSVFEGRLSINIMSNVFYQNFIIKRALNLIINKINFFLCNYYSSSKDFLSNTKSKIVLFHFYFKFFNIYISHLTQFPIITMTLKWDHKNISNKIIILFKNFCNCLTWFLVHLIVTAPIFMPPKK